jgi:hypothetical protein
VRAVSYDYVRQGIRFRNVDPTDHEDDDEDDRRSSHWTSCAVQLQAPLWAVMVPLVTFTIA